MTEHDKIGIEQKLVAYLGGEADEATTAEVEAALASDPALAARRDALRQTMALVEAAATDAGAEAALSDVRRSALRAAADQPAAKAPVLRFRRMSWAAVLVLALGTYAWFRVDGLQMPGSIETVGDLFTYDIRRGLPSVRESTSSEAVALLDPAKDSTVSTNAIGLAGGAGGAEVNYKGPADVMPPGSGGPAPARPSAAPTLNFDTAGVRVFERSVAQEPVMLGAELRSLGSLGYSGGGGQGASEGEGVDLEAHWFGRQVRGGRLAAEERARPEVHDVLEHLHRRHDETPRDMFFRFYGDGPLVETGIDALSTFAADVDTASYPLARGYVTRGLLPPKAAVRTEEFLNLFDSDLPAPTEGDFSILLEMAPSPFAGGDDGITRLLKVGIKAREVAREDAKPMNLVFVVDTSGSMASGNRIELVKRSLELLVDQVRADDSIGIVAFNSNGYEVIQSTRGVDRWKIREAVRALSTGGSTNAGEGLVLGYAMAEGAYREGAINRVILCSDGVANTGETDQARILDQVRSFSERQIDLTSIGVGMGNHNDVFLERLADTGNGSCHYVDDFQEAKRVFVERFTGTLQTVARDVKIQVEFDAEAVRRWRLLGYENRAVADADFRNDSVDAGEVGAGHEVVALYELELAGAADGATAATVRLRWFADSDGREGGAREALETETTIAAADAATRWGLASPRFRLSGAVAQYAEFLRRSHWVRGDDYGVLTAEAERLARELSQDTQVAEFRDMVRATRRLIDDLPPMDELAQLVDEARRMRLHEARLAETGTTGEELLAEVRRRNDELEARIRELIEGGR